MNLKDNNNHSFSYKHTRCCTQGKMAAGGVCLFACNVYMHPKWALPTAQTEEEYLCETTTVEESHFSWFHCVYTELCAHRAW
jgi:hypothetical protein